MFFSITESLGERAFIVNVYQKNKERIRVWSQVANLFTPMIDVDSVLNLTRHILCFHITEIIHICIYIYIYVVLNVDNH